MGSVEHQGSSEYEIRSVRWGDYFRLRSAFKAAFGQDAWSSLDIALALLTPNTVRLIAERRDTVLGFVIGGERRSEIGWIAAIGVEVAARRQGIGTRLLVECERQINTSLVRLTLRRSNTPARALYEKMGYRFRTIWPGYYRDGEDGLVMEKSTGRVGEG